jgi:hypothetical protein
MTRSGQDNAHTHARVNQSSHDNDTIRSLDAHIRTCSSIVNQLRHDQGTPHTHARVNQSSHDNDTIRSLDAHTHAGLVPPGTGPQPWGGTVAPL